MSCLLTKMWLNYSLIYEYIIQGCKPYFGKYMHCKKLWYDLSVVELTVAKRHIVTNKSNKYSDVTKNSKTIAKASGTILTHSS